MKIWKNCERWVVKMGNRTEVKYHFDFSMDSNETFGECLPKSLLGEKPPKGKIYKVHISLAFEEFDEEK